MSSAAITPNQEASIPEFKQILGHPAPLWMLFMTEFWERFAFYGIRWAFVLYIVAQFYGGNASGQADASATYGSYLALIYAAGLFGGLVADKVLGYQRTILLGAVFMAAGLFMIAYPNQDIFKYGLATIIVGNGMFKPNISAMVGKLYGIADERRDSAFTIFYMGINLGAMVSPVITEYLARKVFNIGDTPAYKVVFIASGVGMILSFIWFMIGRSMLKGIGVPHEAKPNHMRVAYVALGALCAIPLIYYVLSLGDVVIQSILSVCFVGLCIALLIEGFKDGKVARDKVIAMLIIFVLNLLFWMFFEQAGSSFTFLAEKLTNRNAFGFEFPVAWYQSINSLAIIGFAPLLAAFWVYLAKRNKNPSIPFKFGLGMIGNGLAFAFLMFAFTSLVDNGKVPFYTLIAVYTIQSLGELCLSPVGLSMTTKLTPARLVGLGMGGWFLSVSLGNNLSGMLAKYMSGTEGLTVQSALSGYTFSFYVLMAVGVGLVVVSPLIQKLMHGVK
jgi:POT family proton-dependent oligopeptide transporter